MALFVCTSHPKFSVTIVCFHAFKLCIIEDIEDAMASKCMSLVMLPCDMGLHLCWHALCLRVCWECQKWHHLWRSHLFQDMDRAPIVFFGVYHDIHMFVLHVIEGNLWSIHYVEWAWVQSYQNIWKHIWNVDFNNIHSICEIPRDVIQDIHIFSSACRHHYVRQYHAVVFIVFLDVQSVDLNYNGVHRMFVWMYA